MFKINLNKEDFISIAKGAGLAGGGALIVYVLEALPMVANFGIYAPIVSAICSVLLNILRKNLQKKV